MKEVVKEIIGVENNKLILREIGQDKTQRVDGVKTNSVTIRPTPDNGIITVKNNNGEIKKYSEETVEEYLSEIRTEEMQILK